MVQLFSSQFIYPILENRINKLLSADPKLTQLLKQVFLHTYYTHVYAVLLGIQKSNKKKKCKLRRVLRVQIIICICL